MIFEILDFQIWELIQEFVLFRVIYKNVLKIFGIASEFFNEFVLPNFALSLQISKNLIAIFIY